MIRRLTLVAAVAAALVACGSSGEAPAGSVTVEGVWARATVPGQTVGAVYLTLEAGADDELLSVAVPADVANAAEVHEVVGGGSDESFDMSEMMSMRPLEDGLALPAGEQVRLEPGGYHVMLVDLAGPLEVGATFEVTLDFAEATSITTRAVVAETAP